MESVGWFHAEEKDDKTYHLVYQSPKHYPISETQSSKSYKPRFLPPAERIQMCKLHYKAQTKTDDGIILFPIDCSPVNDPFKTNINPLLLLSRCNNKEEFDKHDECRVCKDSIYGTYYYLCDNYDVPKYHKECVESPPKLIHPYHPKHDLQLFYHGGSKECYCCQGEARYLVYLCTTCEIFMHPVCAMKSIPFVIDPPKRHDHPLTLFPRQSSLTCNVCGLLRESNHTYICVICDFVTHNDCMNSPHTIKISRHHHRLSYIASISMEGRWSCGVCHQNINTDYGACRCNMYCNVYFVHTKCALGKDVWDGQELNNVPEERSIALDDSPFDQIPSGEIYYFLHDHLLQLEFSTIYDENKFCQACALPIYEATISCKNCDYILHLTCAITALRRIEHGLHPHTLTLKGACGYPSGFFRCNACKRRCSGFVYECPKEYCKFNLDIKCARICDKFWYYGHEHSLFLGFKQVKNPICFVCNNECPEHLICVKRSTCHYIVCFYCATIPYKVRYKHDEHFLTFSCNNAVRENDCCEVCEDNLKDSSTKGFYWCKECYTTLHIDCAFGEDSYLMPDQYFIDGENFHILKVKKGSRPICRSCRKHCQRPIFVRSHGMFCSIRCAYGYLGLKMDFYPLGMPNPKKNQKPKNLFQLVKNKRALLG